MLYIHLNALIYSHYNFVIIIVYRYRNVSLNCPALDMGTKLQYCAIELDTFLK